MACISGSAISVTALVKALATFLTDETIFGTGKAWALKYPSTINDITNDVILEGVGDGTDSIFIGFKIKASATYSGQTDILLNGFAGYDANLSWEEQPGGIEIGSLPCIPLAEGVRVAYWFSANTYRVIIVCQLSTQYESAYVGFLKAVSCDRQYPYPMAVGGSYIEGGRWSSASNGHSCFLDPRSDTSNGIADTLASFPAAETEAEHTTSLRIRRPDGKWCAVINKNLAGKSLHFQRMNVWPQNTDPVNTLTVLDNTLTIENVNFYAEQVIENYPHGIIGEFDGVYFVGNREDLSSKESIVYNSKTYMVFNNVNRRDNDQYFCIEWF
jgi:hypothetical protein